MIKRTTFFAAATLLAMSTAYAAAPKLIIEAPLANAAITAANLTAIVVDGTCTAGTSIQISATDSANKVLPTVWTGCNSYSDFYSQIDLSSLADGNITVKAYVTTTGGSKTATVNVVKSTVPALVLAIQNPVVNAAITAANQAAVVVNGGCNLGSSVQLNATDSAAKVLDTQWTACNAENDFHGQLDLTSLKDGNITIKAYVALNGATKTTTVNVVKNTAPAVSALQILAPVANFAVTASNQGEVDIAGKCTNAMVMKLQATDSANKLSDITWIMCENSNFWGPINMTSLADGNISVRAFQEVNGVMQNQYVNVIKKTTTGTPALAVTLGSLTSVKEGTASNLTVNKVAGTAAGTVAYQVLNNASKAVISSGSLVFAAADTAKTISVLYPKDNVVNAVSLEIKVGSLSSLIVPVTDIDVATPPASTKIMMGINGHDNYAAYPVSEIEARVKLLADRNIRSFRNGGDSASQEPLWPSMDTLIAAGKKYNVTIRPMIYHTLGEAEAYKIARRFPDIRVWEIGNEVDGDVGNEAKNIAMMVQVYNGIKRAAVDMGVELKTTINIMACYTEATPAQGGRCYHKSDGSGYFVDAAYAAGFHFDYISFHYYPLFSDKADLYTMYLKNQMRVLSARYNVKILYNELNCAEIYPWDTVNGNVTDGGYAGDRRCYDSLQQILTELNTNYKDIVQEINIYELLDEPTHEVEHERHFGMMYDINNPKPVFDMVTNQFAK